MFFFEYLHRLHDSITRPALVYTWVLHGPWTHEPSRITLFPEVCLLQHWFWDLCYPQFRFCPFFCVRFGLFYASFCCICLCIFLAFTLGFSVFVGTCVGISLAFSSGFSWNLSSALVLVILFYFISAPNSFFCFSLRPYFNGCIGLGSSFSGWFGP